MLSNNLIYFTGSGQGTLGQLLRNDPALFPSAENDSENGKKNYSPSDIYSFVRSVITLY